MSTCIFSINKYNNVVQDSRITIPDADLEGGRAPPPSPKIRKAYVIQRYLSSSTNNVFMNG